MRFFTIIFTLLLLVGGSPANGAASPTRRADSVVIEKKSLVLVRRGKIARDFPERRRATISYPVVKAGAENHQVLSRVRALLEVKNIFDTSIEEYRQDAWLSEFDYEVNYNKNYILDITFTQSGVAAYPDTHHKHLAIDLKNGRLLKAKDVFHAASHETLAQLIDEKLQAELKQIREAEAARSDVSHEDKENTRELFSNLKFGTEHLDEFMVSDAGITFLYDAGLPHVVQALEPEGKYFFSYAELGQHIMRDSLLGRFIK